MPDDKNRQGQELPNLACLISAAKVVSRSLSVSPGGDLQAVQPLCHGRRFIFRHQACLESDLFSHRCWPRASLETSGGVLLGIRIVEQLPCLTQSLASER